MSRLRPALAHTGIQQSAQSTVDQAAQQKGRAGCACPARSRGFAFVEMSNTAEADRAIAGLNGADFGGRALNVNE
jgi:RNA recognition motif-containing protein